jgi:hypothetical protein
MRCGWLVITALAACGDNAAAPRDAAPPLPPPYDGGPVIDFEEGPEPNGLGVLEASLAPAGIIPDLKPIDERLILHGHLTPHPARPSRSPSRSPRRDICRVWTRSFSA